MIRNDKQIRRFQTKTDLETQIQEHVKVNDQNDKTNDK